MTCGTCAGLTVMSITIRILNILVIKYCKVLNGLEDDHQAGYNGFGTMMLVGFFVNNNWKPMFCGFLNLNLFSYLSQTKFKNRYTITRI